MSIIYHDTTFPRSSRDNCLRHPDPLQGPYRQQRLFARWAWCAVGWAAFAAIGVLLAWRG